MAVYYIEKQGKWRAQLGSKLNRRTKSFNTKLQAEKWEREQREESQDLDPTTWNDLADAYWESVKFTKHKTQRTRSGEKTHSVPILKHFGKMLVVKTDDLVIDDYRELREKTVSPKTKKEIAGNTVRLELAFLGQLMKIAIKRRIISRNYMSLVDKPKLVDKYIRISDEDRVRIFQGQHIPEPFFCYFWLLYSVGCRASELAELQVQHVNLRLKQIYFPRTKNTRSRTVILPDPEFQILVYWLKRKERDPACPYVFPSVRRRDRAYIPFDFSGYWATRKRQLGPDAIDPAISPHSFRHERISRWFEDPRLNEGQIMELSGHLTAAALNRYRHLKAERLRPIVAEILEQDAIRYDEASLSLALQDPESESADQDFEKLLLSL